MKIGDAIAIPLLQSGCTKRNFKKVIVITIDYCQQIQHPTYIWITVCFFPKLPLLPIEFDPVPRSFLFQIAMRKPKQEKRRLICALIFNFRNILHAELYICFANLLFQRTVESYLLFCLAASILSSQAPSSNLGCKILRDLLLTKTQQVINNFSSKHVQDHASSGSFLFPP